MPYIVLVHKVLQSSLLQKAVTVMTVVVLALADHHAGCTMVDVLAVADLSHTFHLFCRFL